MSNALQHHGFAKETLEPVFRKIDLSGARVLDLGSGAGYQSKWFSDRGATVASVDISSPDVELDKFHICDVDAVGLPFENNEFDIVWSHHVFEHLMNPISAMREVNRVLKKNGIFIITVPDEKDILSSWHLSRYNLGLLVYHLAVSGFDMKRSAYGQLRSHCKAVAIKASDAGGCEFRMPRLVELDRLPVRMRAPIINGGRFSEKDVGSRWRDDDVRELVLKALEK